MLLMVLKHPLNFVLSLYFNIRYLPLKVGFRFPFWVTANLKIKKLQRGQITVCNPGMFCIRIGVEGSPGMQSLCSVIYISKGGKISFGGPAIISSGTVVRCDSNASIIFGENFYCNCNCFLRSTRKIQFGRNCSLGWNVQLNTSDGHSIWRNGKLTEMEGPIVIGDGVWITSNCSFVKNTAVGDGCVVAQGAVVTKRFNDVHCLIGGVPARVVASNIEWKA